MGETGVPRGERLEADEPVSQRGLLNRLDESRLNTEGGLPPHAPIKIQGYRDSYITSISKARLMERAHTKGSRMLMLGGKR